MNIKKKLPINVQLLFELGHTLQIARTILVESKIKLSLNKLRILFLLYKQGELSTNKLSNFLEISAPAVTQLINDLEERGLVKRKYNPQNRRVTLIKITTKGKIELFKTLGIMAQKTRKLFKILDKEDKKAILRIIKKINSNI